MPLPTGFKLEGSTSPQLPAGFSIEPATQTTLPSGFQLEESKQPNIFERGANKFQSVKQNIKTGISNLANEPLDKLTIPGDIVRAGQSVGDFFQRAKPLADPNVSFPGFTGGRAGDISMFDMAAPITRQVASSAGDSFSKGFGGFIPGLLKSAILPEALVSDTVGTGITLLGDVIGNVADLGDQAFRGGVLGEDPGRKFIDRFVDERTKEDLPSIGEATEAKARPEALDKAMARIESGVPKSVAQALMVTELTAKGIGTDVIREAVIQLGFLGAAKGAQGAGKARRLAGIRKDRADLRDIRIGEAFEGQAGRPGQLALPAPGKRPFGGGQLGAQERAIEGQVGEGFVIEQPGLGVKRPVGFRDPVEIPGREAPQAVKQIFGPRAGNTIDVKGSVSKPKPPSRAVKLAQADKAAKIARADEQVAANRRSVVQEKINPKKPTALPPPSGKIKPPEGIQGPIAGRGFVVKPSSEPISVIKKPAVRENVIEKASRMNQGKSIKQIEADKARAALRKPEPTPKEMRKIQKDRRLKGNIPESIKMEKFSKKSSAPKKRNIIDQVKDVGKVIKGLKQKGLGANFGNVRLDVEGINAAKRLGKDALGSGKSLNRYLTEDKGMSQREARNVAETLRKEAIFQISRISERDRTPGEKARLNKLLEKSAKRKQFESDVDKITDDFLVEKGAKFSPENSIKQAQIRARNQAAARVERRAQDTERFKIIASKGNRKHFDSITEKYKSTKSYEPFTQKELDRIYFEGTEIDGRFGNRGSAQAFGDKKPTKTSAGDKEARVIRQREKIAALKAEKEGKIAPGKTATIGDLVDKKADSVKFKRKKTKAEGKGKEKVEIGGDIEIERPVIVDAVDSAGRSYKKSVGGTKVGSHNVGQMVEDGVLTERGGKIFVAIGKANPAAAEKLPITTAADREAAIGNPSLQAALDLIAKSNPKEFSALHDTPVNQALSVLKRALDNGTDVAHVMDDIADDLLLARKVQNILGVNLNAIRKSVATGKIQEILENRLAQGNLNKLEEAQLRDALGKVGSKKARTSLVRTFDMVTEYGINAMLSSPVTFVRNLVGSAAGVSSQIPVKIAQATVSEIGAKLGIAQTERAYFQELGPEIAGMMRGFIIGIRKGSRFLKHEDISRVFKSIDDKINLLKTKHIPKGMSFSKLKRDQKARLLKQLRNDMKDLLTEEELTRAAELGFTRPTRDIPGKLGEGINVPVRALVATDKVFQTTSASGHIAARRVRSAINQRNAVISKNKIAKKEGRPLRKVRTVKEYLKDVRLSRAEIEEAKNDALFYVFREKLGPKLAGVQNRISETPIMPLIIPFFKSRVNFLKFALKNSPLGFFDSIGKSLGTTTPSKTSLAIKGTDIFSKTARFATSRTLDTKSAARALSGTAVMLGIHAFFEKNKDTIELQPSAGSSAERSLRRDSGIGEQVVVFGTDLQDPKKRKVTHTEPYANLAPFSAPLEFEALVQEYYRRLKGGQRADEAFAKTLNKAMTGVLNQSAFGSVKDTVRAFENMADTTVALGPDGKPEVSTVMRILTGPVADVLNKKIAGVTIPNFVRDITKLTDKRVFDPKGLIQRLQSELPFIPKDNINVRQTTFGKDALRTQKRLPNPFNRPKIDSAIEEMLRLEVFPTKTPRQLSESGLKLILTDEERQQFNVFGKEMKDILDIVVEMDFYKDSNDVARGILLESVKKEIQSAQITQTKSKALLRLLNSEEGLQQMITGITKGRQF